MDIATQLARLLKEHQGKTMSTISGGVEQFGDVRKIIWYDTDKCFRAVCKFYNEDAFFYKKLGPRGEIL